MAVAASELTLRLIERDSVVACAVLAAAAAVLTRRLDAPLGVLGGGALVAISYRGIKAGIVALVEFGEASGNDGASGAGRRPGGRQKVAVGLVKFFTRYAILAVVAYVIMA